ncbi:hypothetical protein BN1723_012015 [Verticillium longisporum]|uniref:Beta-glucosidase cel3A n=1 Tax=Verticillium longisporum TaxID=100787 RepID=A0A0G4LDL9_VERLO|nr:hypothetical protein BN1723_012015 [Verticillium longisporum]
MDASQKRLLAEDEAKLRRSHDGYDSESDIDVTEHLAQKSGFDSKDQPKPAFLGGDRPGILSSWKRPFKGRSRCCIIFASIIFTLWAVLSAGGAVVYHKYTGAPPLGQSPPWYPTPLGGTAKSWAESYKKAADLVSKMTLPEKVNITTGTGWRMGLAVGTTGPATNVGFPQLQLQDGPLGIRFADNSTAWPAGITTGATFNKELFYLRGKGHANEARRKGINVLLGPCVGPLGRMPAGGRNWEGFGSDPYLQGIAAAETIKGIQGEGVMATIKHFVANEQEHFRQSWEWGLPNALSSNIDDRTMHELYAWPFADSIKAGVASVMCSYNMVNNSYACVGRKVGARLGDARRGQLVSLLVLADEVEAQGDDDDDEQAVAAHVGGKGDQVAGLVALEEDLGPDGVAGGPEDKDVCFVFANADAGEGFLAWGSVGGDRNDLFLQKGGDDLILYVAENCGSGKGDTVVVIHSVGPVDLEAFIDLPNVKAVLYANLPGQESGDALAEVVFGDVNPNGHLPYTIAKSLKDFGAGGQIMYLPNGVNPQQDFSEGLYIDYRHFDKYNIEPRFEFGFGLSYTTFEFSDIKVKTVKDKSALPSPRPSDAGAYPYPDGYETSHPLSGAGGDEGGNPDLWETYATVTVEVSNTGEVAGKVVPQLYLSHPDTEKDIDFPVRVLRGFEKFNLEKGEKKSVSFHLTRRDLSYWDVVQQNWVMVTSGEYTFSVGQSSRDLPLQVKW